jgi:hypothetical protein
VRPTERLRLATSSRGGRIVTWTIGISAYVVIATALFYLVPGLQDSPAAGSAGHFGKALGLAVFTAVVSLLMLRFVIRHRR